MNSNQRINKMPEIDTGLKETEIIRIVDVLRENQKVGDIILFGSRAKGNYKKGSDIDIAVHSDNLTVSELLQLKSQLDELLLPYKIDVVVYKNIQNQALRDHINRVGISVQQLVKS